MNALNSTLVTAALMCTSAVAFAHEGSGHDGNHHRRHHGGMMHSQMKSMDANNDGLITKAEFMKAHEAKWNELPKNSDGAISLADMEKAHQERMQDRRTQKHEAMMQDHEKMMREHEKLMEEADADKNDGATEEKPAN